MAWTGPIPGSVTGIKARALRNRLRLDIEASAAPEVERADAERKSDLFKKAFDTELELVWRHPQQRRRLISAPESQTPRSRSRLGNPSMVKNLAQFSTGALPQPRAQLARVQRPRASRKPRTRPTPGSSG